LDNITHALAGMLLAEAVCVARGETRQPLRAAAYLVSALANNLPDIDIVYTWITGPKPLGSLLHHRGHTHTLLLALPGAWLLALGVWRWFSRRHADAAPRDRRLFLGLALAGVVLHLGMDLGNNYGVHPFWPVSDKWFYGDTIFIVEPLWWAIAIPVVAEAARRRWLKLTLWVLLAAVLTVCWFVPFVGMTSRFSLLAVTALAFVLAKKASPRLRIRVALAAAMAVPVVFALAGARARAALRDATQAAFPALTVLDMATTPMPANPACWEGLVAGEQGGQYRVLRATVALGPVAAGDCRAGMDVEPTAPVTVIARANHGGVRWLTAYSADVAALGRLRQTDCRFAAMLRFARLPYVSASGKIAGDLRYDRGPELDFSDVPLPPALASGACPRWVPGWAEPRADLFPP
jgi:inner membrane protein